MQLKRRAPLLLILVSCGDGSTTPQVGAGALAGQTCMQLQQQAWARLTPALAAAQADLRCQSDDDCVDASVDTKCTASCGDLLNRQGVAAINATIAQVNTDVCAAFVSQSCTLIAPPCVPRVGGAACVAGMCSYFPTTRWRSFVVDRHAGSSVSLPPSCVAGQDCTVWTITPDGALAKIAGGQPSSSMLSSADLATIDGILRGMAFRQKEQMGFQCGPAAGGVTFEVQRAEGTTGFDVGACLAASTDPDVVRLYQVVAAY